MAQIFQIVPGDERVTLDPEGKGTLELTVTNLARSVAGRVLFEPLEGADKSWFSVAGGENERELPANIPEDFELLVEVPEETPPGTYSFRVDVVSELAPDEDFSEGPPIEIVKPPKAKRRLWLWISIAVASLLLLLLLLYLLFGGDEKEKAGAGAGAAEAAASDSQEPGSGEPGSGEPGSGEPGSGAAGSGAAGSGATGSGAAGSGAGAASPGRGTVMIGLETPNFMGLSPPEAQEQAKTSNLRLEPETWLEHWDLVVADQTPRPGTFVAEGGTVTLELHAEVPNFVGQELDDSRQVLELVGLDLGEVKYSVSERQEAGEVLQQSAAPGVRMPAGTAVDLSISLGSCYVTPPVTGGFGPSTCQSGMAVTEISRVFAGFWQMRCCPYSPGLDPGFARSSSDWFDERKLSAPAVEGAVLGGLECRDAECTELRVAYLRSPRLQRKPECESQTSDLDKTVARCAEGSFVSGLACRDSRCREVEVACCPATPVPPA